MDGTRQVKVQAKINFTVFLHEYWSFDVSNDVFAESHMMRPFSDSINNSVYFLLVAENPIL